MKWIWTFGFSSVPGEPPHWNIMGVNRHYARVTVRFDGVFLGHVAGECQECGKTLAEAKAWVESRLKKGNP